LLGVLAFTPVKRVVTEDVPIPFSPPMEKYVEPTEEKIIQAVEEVLD
jgi:pyruvate/2-oxoglutarate/acetoin dehydrogenase E1 component